MAAQKDELTEAVKAWERATRKRAKVNKDAKAASEEARQRKEDVERILAERKQDGVKVGGSLVSRYVETHYYVVEANRAEFEKWAEDQDEEYLEPNRRVRQDTLNSNMQELVENGQPLPPGVSSYPEVKVSKRKA